MQHLIGLIASQLPFACAIVALHGHIVGHSFTFLAMGGMEKSPRNLKNI
ncbi:hypothetical protein [Sphingopyxis terrae]|uniref:Uncharacterized protein n=1 Tax=Sphingopyxis terrae subsp. ummariensis TaxID=429001 RepID=A0A1Y6ECC5_9SPHN|nr:hypothetical protein [Sphingopyxis terrae]SMQ57823.1 hypothetical protein SAMN06295984_0005 [Sphingopyxis terrae subsp. ummariensis]